MWQFCRSRMSSLMLQGLLAISKPHEKLMNHISQNQLKYTIFHERIGYLAVFLHRKELNCHFLAMLSPFVSFFPLPLNQSVCRSHVKQSGSYGLPCKPRFREVRSFCSWIHNSYSSIPIVNSLTCRSAIRAQGKQALEPSLCRCILYLFGDTGKKQRILGIKLWLCKSEESFVCPPHP